MYDVVLCGEVCVELGRDYSAATPRQCELLLGPGAELNGASAQALARAELEAATLPVKFNTLAALKRGL